MMNISFLTLVTAVILHLFLQLLVYVCLHSLDPNLQEGKNHVLISLFRTSSGYPGTAYL